MAKPNYAFEKRQRDLAKKHKQEEKRLQRLANKSSGAEAPQAHPAGETTGVPAFAGAGHTGVLAES